MNKKKLGMMLASMGLVGVVAIGGTLAYFTQQTNQVTNTFTVGDGYDTGDVKLYEHEALKDDTEGSATNGDFLKTEEEVIANNYVNIMPEAMLDKDPTVRLAADSPNSRVFMSVKGLDAIEADGFDVEYSAGVNLNPNWIKIAEIDGTTETDDVPLTAKLDGIYVYITTETELDNEPLFNTIKAPGNFDSVDEVSGIANIELRAAAVQAEGTTNETALDAVKTGLLTFE